MHTVPQVINCDKEGVEFVLSTDFALSPSESDASTVHLFSLGLKSRCMFKIDNITIDPKNIIDDCLIIPKQSNELFHTMIDNVHNKIIDIIQKDSVSNDQIISGIYYYNDYKLKLSESSKKYLLDCNKLIQVSFLWKFNIIQQFKYWGSKKETTTTLLLFLLELTESYELPKLQKEGRILINI